MASNSVADHYNAKAMFGQREKPAINTAMPRSLARAALLLFGGCAAYVPPPTYVGPGYHYRPPPVFVGPPSPYYGYGCGYGGWGYRHGYGRAPRRW